MIQRINNVSRGAGGDRAPLRSQEPRGDSLNAADTTSPTTPASIRRA